MRSNGRGDVPSPPLSLSPSSSNDVTTQVYKERVLDVTVNCATEAAAHGTKRFIQMSCARVYDCDKVM